MPQWGEMLCQHIQSARPGRHRKHVSKGGKRMGRFAVSLALPFARQVASSLRQRWCGPMYMKSVTAAQVLQRCGSNALASVRQCVESRLEALATCSSLLAAPNYDRAGICWCVFPTTLQTRTPGNMSTRRRPEVSALHANPAPRHQRPRSWPTPSCSVGVWRSHQSHKVNLSHSRYRSSWQERRRNPTILRLQPKTHATLRALYLGACTTSEPPDSTHALGE